MKTSYSRKKICDQFAGMSKADGTPMSRQQVHIMRKKARGICLTCGKPAVGVYCLKHTIAARERMRLRLRRSQDCVRQKQARSRPGLTVSRAEQRPRSKVRAKAA